jgi:hypothetical protein
MLLAIFHLLTFLETTFLRPEYLKYREFDKLASTFHSKSL